MVAAIMRVAVVVTVSVATDPDVGSYDDRDFVVGG